MTRNAPRIGIIGYPLGHTLSPTFQNAALRHSRMETTFEVWPTPPEDLAARVASLRSPGFLGACVALPHKQSIMPLLDAVHATARGVGAVNWLVNGSAGSPDGRLTGYNTDAPGFLRSLREEAKFDPSATSAVVFGAGGAARAVVFALRSAGVARLAIANRTVEKARALAASVSGEGFSAAGVGLSSRELADIVPHADLVINATVMGMAGGPAPDASPLSANLLRPGALGYDVVYAPLETPFLREVTKAGGRTASGITLLLYQGAEGFTLCTGHRAPVEVMKQALMHARAA